MLSAWRSRRSIYAFTTRLKNEEGFGVLFRLGMIPLFLFSGAFFPIANLAPVDGVARPADAAVARRRPLADVRPRQRRLVRWPRSTSSTCSSSPRSAGAGRSPASTKRLVTDGHPRPRRRRAARSARSAPCQATGLLFYRNYIVYRRAWWIFLSGFLEPVFYLFSIGIGVGQLVTASSSTARRSRTPSSSRPACSPPRP